MEKHSTTSTMFLLSTRVREALAHPASVFGALG